MGLAPFYLQPVENKIPTHLNEKNAGFELHDLNGNLIKSADFKGKVLVLDFWTTWCGACVKA